jgi:serine/threonine-protein kinase
VSHPNVARIHDLIADSSGLKYISMAYIAGKSLRDLLNENGRLPFARALPILRNLCSGLQAAHDVGVVHRDFKPENIMVDSLDHPYITDFGIARSVACETVTQTSGITGTLQYMSPEQARGETAVQRSDIYSLGLVAYEMITGRLPHETDTTPEFVGRLMGKKALDPRSHEPDIPAYMASRLTEAVQKLGILFRGRSLQTAPRTDFGQDFVCS